MRKLHNPRIYFESDSPPVHKPVEGTLKRRCPWCETYENFECTFVKDWEKHVLWHNCEHCRKYVTHIDLHACDQMRGGHIDAGHESPENEVFKEVQRAHRGVLRQYRGDFTGHVVDIADGFTFMSGPLTRILDKLLESHNSIIVSATMEILMEREKEGIVRRKYMYFNTRPAKIFNSGEIPAALKAFAQKITTDKDNFLEGTSTWKVIKLNFLEINVGELDPLQRSRPEGSVAMPEAFKKKRGILLLDNDDKLCFQYCIVAHLCMKEVEEKNRKICDGDAKLRHHVKNCEKWKQYFDRANFQDVQDGVEIYGNLRLFEKRNKIAVRVFSHLCDEIVLIRETYQQAEDSRRVNLFLIRGEGEQKSHFVLIKDLDLFLGHVVPRHKSYFCQKCLNHFPSLISLAKHVIDCRSELEENYQFPAANSRLEFRRWIMTMPITYIVYYDFVSYQIPNLTPKGIDTIVAHELAPASFSLTVVEKYGEEVKVIHTDFYSGPDPVKAFYERIFRLAKELITLVRNTNNLVVPTAEERKRHEEAEVCDLCGVNFSWNRKAGQADNLFKDEEEEEYSLDEVTEKMKEYYGSGDGEEEFSEILTDCDEIYDTFATESTGQENKKQESSPKSSFHKYSEKMRARCYDHCHRTGRYRHSLCVRCNLALSAKHELLLVSMWDRKNNLHHLIEHMDQGKEQFHTKDVKVLGKDTENFVQIQIKGKEYLPSLVTRYGMEEKDCEQDILNNCGQRKVKIRMINGSQFIHQPLSTVSDILWQENDPYFSLLLESLQSQYPDVGITLDTVFLLQENLRLCSKVLTGANVLDDDINILEKEHFEDEEELSESRWNNLRYIFKLFQLSTVRQYIKLFNLFRASQLALVYEVTRRNGIQECGLDMSYTGSLSGFTWQSWLYKSRSSIEILRDEGIYRMIEESIVGGLSGTVRKYFKANHERCPDYNPVKPRVHIASFDKVSLYGFSLLQPYPHSEYEWMTTEQLEMLDFEDPELGEKTNYGYIVDVAMSYPPSVQEKSQEMPFMPYKACVNIEMLPEPQRKLVQHLQSASFVTEPRLILSCFDRDSVVVNHRLLHYYLSQGLKIKKVNRGVRFREQKYFESFVTDLMEKRRLTTNESLRDYYKRKLNCVYGRCLTDSRNRVDIKFVDNMIDAKLWLGSHRLKEFKILSKDLSVFVLKPKKILQNNLIMSGFSVLQYSKRTFYDGYFGELKGIFGDDILLLRFETDGIACAVYDNNNDFYKKLWEKKHLFDFSKISPSHPLITTYPGEDNLCELNRSKAGLWKVENVDHYEYISVKNKTFSSVDLVQESGQIVLKGRKKCSGYSQKDLSQVTHNMLKEMVFDTSKNIELNVSEVRSINYKLFQIYVNKVSFSSLDISRIFLSPTVSYPFGYYNIKERATENRKKLKKM